MDPKQLVLGTVCPILGAVLSSLMYISPLKAAFLARKNKKIGDLNPLPLAVTFWCASSWLTYGFAADVPIMLPASVIGMAASLFAVMCCYGLVQDKVQEQLLLLTCGAAMVLPLLGSCTFVFMHTLKQRAMAWGLIANILTVMYYSAPLSTARMVMRTRNSASLHRPMIVANIFNGAMWTAYGLAVSDIWIMLPNGIGIVCALMLLLLCAVYPSRSTPTTAPGSDDIPDITDQHQAFRASDIITATSVKAQLADQPLRNKSPQAGSTRQVVLDVAVDACEISLGTPGDHSVAGANVLLGSTVYP